MLLRIASAIVLIPAVLVTVIYAPPVIFMIALGVVGTLCLYEYFGLVRLMGFEGQPWFGYVAFWILFAGLQQKWFPSAALLSLVLIAGFLAAVWRRCALRDRLLGLMANLLGTLYFALFLFPALALRFEFGNKLGLQWFLVLLTVVWTCDTAALLVGKTLGRTPFAPLISPKKTNEGAAGGFLAGILAAALLHQIAFHDLPLRHVIAAAALVAVFSQMGDLAESLLKRAAQVKDSSHLIPGHGGVLDRVDSLLFAFPVLYFYLFWLYRP